jgi:hypothetical protein
VIAAYPITPQTHIVEAISRLVADGELDAELVSVESEFSAASVVLGAAAAGSRAYTASSSQGILLMAEVLYNIAGLRVPLVMTCANRAVGAPLSIWNDQQDSMAVRDAGWIQLYCVDNQQAVDTTVQAFRIAEACELPVMVCMDGFTLTHTMERVELPTAAQVDRYLPPYRFARMLDPARPQSIGTLVTPDYFSELRHAHHVALERAGRRHRTGRSRLEETHAPQLRWTAGTHRPGRCAGGGAQHRLHRRYLCRGLGGVPAGSPDPAAAPARVQAVSRGGAAGCLRRRQGPDRRRAGIVAGHGRDHRHRGARRALGHGASAARAQRSGRPRRARRADGCIAAPGAGRAQAQPAAVQRVRPAAGKASRGGTLR